MRRPLVHATLAAARALAGDKHAARWLGTPCVRCARAHASLRAIATGCCCLMRGLLRSSASQPSPPVAPLPRSAPPSTSPTRSSPQSLTTSCCCMAAPRSITAAGRELWTTLPATAAPARSVRGLAAGRGAAAGSFVRRVRPLLPHCKPWLRAGCCARNPAFLAPATWLPFLPPTRSPFPSPSLCRHQPN